MVDLIQIRASAREKEDENWRFRQFLKTQCRLEPSEIDERVYESTRRVWAGIDCTSCANCCRELQPSLNEEEVARLAQRFEMTRQQFTDAYLERTDADDESPWRTRTKPCPFLKDNRCGVYEDRPADCRAYPYLYEPEFVLRTIGMIARTSTCPIMFEVMEELKRSAGFLRSPSIRDK